MNCITNIRLLIGSARPYKAYRAKRAGLMSVLRTPRPAIPDGERSVDDRQTTHAWPSGSVRTATRPPAGGLEAPQWLGHAGNVRRPCPCRHRAYAFRPLRCLGPTDLERPNVNARATPDGSARQPVLRRNCWSAAAPDNVGRRLRNRTSRGDLSLNSRAPSQSAFRPSRLAPRALGPSARRPSLRRALYFSGRMRHRRLEKRLISLASWPSCL